jgi:cytochrome c peroxidase
MTAKRLMMVVLVAVGAVLLGSLGALAGSDEVILSESEALGKEIFFDELLSLNGNQSCASCHGPESGFTGADTEFNSFGGAVYEGSVAGLFGDRKPPSAAYATPSPIFHLDKKGTWTGGNFWDGRATGELLGNPAADQAQGPFVNPVEQALPDSACVAYFVTTGPYGGLFESVWGTNASTIAWPADVSNDCTTSGTTVSLDLQDRAKADMAFDQIALSIADYEASPEVNAFSSKFDLKEKLTKQEQQGRRLFQGRARCSVCHTSNGRFPLFTDYTFDNLGVPANPDLAGGVDYGLGGALMAAGYDEDVYEDELGKHKVPTLRNVDKGVDDGIDKAYMHNGYFKTLEGVVDFYNTRDVKPVCPGLITEAQALVEGCWPAPEVSDNVNSDELGDLGLSPEDEAAIVAFLKILTDK